RRVLPLLEQDAPGVRALGDRRRQRGDRLDRGGEPGPVGARLLHADQLAGDREPARHRLGEAERARLAPVVGRLGELHDALQPGVVDPAPDPARQAVEQLLALPAEARLVARLAFGERRLSGLAVPEAQQGLERLDALVVAFALDQAVDQHGERDAVERVALQARAQARLHVRELADRALDHRALTQ